MRQYIAPWLIFLWTAVPKYHERQPSMSGRGNPSSKKTTAKVELSFTCTKLLDLDKFSKSDPFLILSKITAQQSGNDGWTRLGRTEVIDDSLNPQVAN